MKHLFTIMIGFCCMGVITSSSFAGAQLWTFEFDADDWKVANGNWSVEEGVYKLAAGSQAEHSLIGNASWADYTIETKIRVDQGNWAGVICRAKSEMEYYVFYFNVPDNKTELWRHKVGGWAARDNIGQLPAQNVEIRNGEWYDMKVTAAGDLLALSINGEEQGEFTDTVYGAGQAGAWGWETGASFDDFLVYGDDIEDNGTLVEPLDKLTTIWGRIKRDR